MKIKTEPIFLILVFGILLFLGFGGLFSRQLVHDFPQGTIANDAFYKYNRAHYLIESGNFKYQEWYTAEGRKDTDQDDAPLTYFLTAIYSLNSGIPDFDTYQFLGILVKILSVFVMYLIIRKLNKKIALAAIGITGFIFIKNNFISFHYGWIPITLAGSLIVFVIWILLSSELEYIWIILGLALAGVMLTHLSEFWYTILIVGLYFCYLLLINKLNFKILKNPLLALIIFIPTTLYYLPVSLRQFFSLASSDTGIVLSAFRIPTFPITVLKDFGFFLPLIIVGIILSAYYCLKDKEKFKFLVPILTITAVSFLPLFNFSDRIYQIRFFWPVFFMLFFGFAIYFILNLNFIKKYLKHYSNEAMVIVSLLLLVLSINYYYAAPNPSSLIVNQDIWNGMQWVQQNIPENIEDNSILVVHGDSYQQVGTFLMFGRIIYQIKDEDYLAKLNTGQVSKNYVIRKFIHGYDYFKRTGFFTFEPIKLGKPEWEETRGWEETDLCSFDYYVIDKPSRFPQVTAYNLKIRETLLKNNNFEEVFSNSWYSILKNNNPGADCLGE